MKRNRSAALEEWVEGIDDALIFSKMFLCVCGFGLFLKKISLSGIAIM